jgi:putative methyltransferase (TIGR04325 family)
MRKNIKLFAYNNLRNLLKRENNPQYGFFGNYKTWEDAEKECTGYGANNILEKVKNSLLQVKSGLAVYERDSVLINEIQYSWHLLSCFLKAAVENENRLHILDFGGSLGSSFFQNKPFLPPLKEFSWNIVEQAHFVDCGRKHFQDETLHFYPDILSCSKEHKCNVLLLSGVLQYLKNPYELIEQFKKLKCTYVIIDRTPFTSDNSDRISVQKVPPEIYQASYVHRFFNEAKLLDVWTSSSQGSERYKVLCSFDVHDWSNVENTYYKGFILKLQSESKTP